MAKKKKIILIILLILFLLTCSGWIYLLMIEKPDRAEDTWKVFNTSLQEKEVIIDAFMDHSRTYLITSKEGRSDYGDTLSILEQQSEGNWERIYDNDFKDLKPWKIELADIDGDGEKEIVTAVHKTAHFDKEEKNRLFIFQYTENKLVKIWTGSEIAGEWENFIVGDFVSPGGDELIFIRQTKEGERVSVYYWFEFGFLMLAESKDYENIKDISITRENSILLTYKKKNKKYTVTLAAKDGNLAEVTKEN